MFQRRICTALLLSTAAILTGCGVSPSATTTTPHPAHMNGIVHGGQQPVAFSTIQLYTVGTTGDGSASTSILTQTVQSDANGNFSLNNLYSCTSATYVYITATGGQPLTGQSNANLAMMSALGPCSALNQSTFITINEVTTVAAVAAFVPFMTGPANIGSGSSDLASLLTAFATASELANSATGTAPGTGIPTGASVPSALINTLANILAACINTTGGSYGDSGTLCGQLFTLTKVGSAAAPTDTISALLNLEKNPTLSTAALFTLGSATGPFQPTMAVAPADFGVRVSPNVSSLVLQVGPSSLTFPSTVTGTTSAAQTVLLENMGTTAITLSSLSLTGANASEFATTSTCGATLAASGSCTVSVTSTPAATGTRNAYLSIASTSPDSPQYVSLTGTGVSSSTGTGSALLSTHTLSYNFVGTTQDVTLTNIGTGPLQFYGVTSTDATGSNFYNFTVGEPTTSNNCPSTLAAGSSCTISIVSVSAAGGGVVISTSDTTTSGIITTSVIGSYAFQNIYASSPTAVGSSSTAYMYLFASTSATGFSYVISGANAADFSAPTSCSSGTCQLTLTFTPHGTGVRTAKYLPLSTGEYVPLWGLGVTSMANAATTTLTSGTFTTDPVTQVKTTTYTLSNLDSVADTISSITLSPGFTETDNCGTSVFAQSTCQIYVTYPPTTQQTLLNGVLVVSDSHGTYFQNPSHYGSGGTATIPVLAPLRVGQTGTYNGTVYSNSLYSIVVDVTVSGTDFSGGASGCIIRGGSGTSCPYTYYWKPTTVGPAFGTITAGSSTTTPTISLLGYAFPASGPYLYFNYPTPGLGGVRTVGGLNAGTTTLNLTAALSGLNAADFTLTNPCTAVASGANCLVTATLSPSATGERFATMTLTDTPTGMSWVLPISAVNSTPDPAPSISPTSYAFPATQVHVLSDPVNFTFTTVGNHAATAAITSGATNYALTKSACALGESPCVISVIYKPQTTGTLTGTLTITDTQTGLSKSASLTALAGLGTASFSPSPLTFVSRPVGSTSAAIPITMSNTGTASITGISASLSGTNASEFTLANTCSTLTATATCSLSVVFSPTSAGTKSASVTVSGSGSTNLPATVLISGSAY